MVYNIADLERRLTEGDWLLIGEVAAILGISRASVDRMLGGRIIRYRTRPGSGAYRECKPEDVLRELTARRLEREGRGSEATD